MIALVLCISDIRLVRSAGTVYIREDGSIDPPTATISTLDNITYTLTDNIIDSIVIERGDIILDGAGFMLEGDGTGSGVRQTGLNNITIKNLNINGFYYGIYLENASACSILNSNITANIYDGIYLLESPQNTISLNNVSSNGNDGIKLWNSSWGNIISGNTITHNNDDGLQFYESPDNVVSANLIQENNDIGVHVRFSSNSRIYANNIRDNFYGIQIRFSSNDRIYGNNVTGSNDGIYTYNCTNDAVYSNNITANNWHGIWLDTSTGYELNNNTITGLSQNEMGIYISFSSAGNVFGNTILSNGQFGIRLESSPNNIIQENTVSNSTVGIYMRVSTDNWITENNVTGNGDGLWLSGFSAGNVFDNTIHLNTQNGIRLEFNSEIHVEGNSITNNSAGIYLFSSTDNWITENNVTGNGDGLSLSGSSDNTISRNNVANNDVGVKASTSVNNIAYHNNFINNTDQGSSTAINLWDDGLEGNYWSDYAGPDFNKDGIGDLAYAIDTDNWDNYPLMGEFHHFTTAEANQVNIVSNSTIDTFQSFRTPFNISIIMLVSNTTVPQTGGFARVCIPNLFMTDVVNVTVDGAQPSYANYTLHDNGTHNWIYYEYGHSTLEIIISGFDDTPPTIDILSPTANVTYGERDIPLSFTVAEPVSWSGYSLDGAANQTAGGNVTLLGVTDGPHTIVVYANDTAGNMGNSTAVQFAVDASPPTITVLSPENRTYSTTNVSLSFTLDEAASWMGYSLDGAANVTLSGNTTLTSLSITPHSIIVYANDTLDNMGHSDPVLFTIDTGLPTVTLLSPENRTYSTGMVALTFTVDNATSWMGYSLDGAANTTILGNTTLSLLEGSHSVVVYANDTLGKMGASDTVHFTVSFIPPNIMVLSPENRTYSSSMVALTFTVDNVTSWMGYSLDGQSNTTTLENTTLTLLEGSHSVVVYANDTLGKMGSSDTVHFTVDLTAPNITAVIQYPPADNVQPDDEVSVNASITDVWSSVKWATLNYTLANGTSYTENMTDIGGDVWTATIPAYPYCTNVTYVIQATDQVGNSITTEEMGFEYQYHVIPEFASLLLLPVFMLATFAIAVVLRKGARISPTRGL